MAAFFPEKLRSCSNSQGTVSLSNRKTHLYTKSVLKSINFFQNAYIHCHIMSDKVPLLLRAVHSFVYWKITVKDQNWLF